MMKVTTQDEGCKNQLAIMSSNMALNASFNIREPDKHKINPL